MKHPEKPDIPDDPRKTLPDYKRPCPNCGLEESIAEMNSERELLKKAKRGSTYRIDYWCSECDEYVGGKVDWDGAVPVKTRYGTEMH